MSEIQTDSVVNVSGDNDSGIDLSTNDVVAIKTANSERMRIDSSGRVGIGATNMDEMLLIQQTESGANTDVTIRSANDGNSRLNFGDQSSDGSGRIDYDHSSNFLAITTNSSERMRIDSSGKLLIGVTSFTSGGGGIKFGGVGDRDLSVNGTASIQQIGFHNPNGEVGSIFTSGSSTSFAEASDHRLKENVTNMTGAIERVKTLAPKRFNFISDADTTVDGFLAHEAQTVVPEAVLGTHNEVDDDGNAVMQAIDKSKLVPLLTGALQEAINKIETLEAKVAALEAGE